MTEDEFKEFAATATKEQLKEFAESLSIGVEHDYTKRHWGHDLMLLDNKVGEFAFKACIWSSRQLSVGDIILAEATSGETGMYMILNLNQMSNPRDQFFAWMACIGIKK